jgi:hypothetical protein
MNPLTEDLGTKYCLAHVASAAAVVADSSGGSRWTVAVEV